MNYSIFIRPEINIREIIMDDISPAPDPHKLSQEIEALMKDHVILRTPPYVLLVCDLENRPSLRQELGRQRETTFRLAGESTGLPLDIDAYDDYYQQLIIWDSVAHKLVGGYRFGDGDKIYAKYGIEGFYIHS